MSSAPRRSKRKTKGVPPKRLRQGSESGSPEEKRNKTCVDNPNVLRPTTMDVDIVHMSDVADLDRDETSVLSRPDRPAPQAGPDPHPAGDHPAEQPNQLADISKCMAMILAELEASKQERKEQESRWIALNEEVAMLKQQTTMVAAQSSGINPQTTNGVLNNGSNSNRTQAPNTATSSSANAAMVSNNTTAATTVHTDAVGYGASTNAHSTQRRNMTTVEAATTATATSLANVTSNNNEPAVQMDGQPQMFSSYTASTRAPSRPIGQSAVMPTGSALPVSQTPFSTAASTYAANAVIAAPSSSADAPHLTQAAFNCRQLYTSSTIAGSSQAALNAQSLMVPYMNAQPNPFGPASSAQQFESAPNNQGFGAQSAQWQAPSTAMARAPTPAYTMHERRRLHDLPSFSGKPEEWPLFFHSFCATSQAFGYSELENQLRLQKCLIGPARAAVESMLIEARNVGQAIATLEMRFGHPNLLVKSQLEQAKRLPAIDEEHIEQLVTFATCIQNLSAYLDTDATHHHLANPELLDVLLSKLPMSRRIDWASVVMRIDRIPTVKDFASWVTELARLVNLVSSTTSTTSTRANNARPQQRRGYICAVSSPECAFCDSQHETSQCGEFLQLTIKERWREIRRRQLCYVCLRFGHIIESCDRKAICGIGGCELFHHKELHDGQRDESNRAWQGRARPQKNGNERHANTSSSARSGRPVGRSTNGGEAPEDATASVNIVKSHKPNSALLFRILPVVLHGRGRKIETFAMFDEGSNITLIDASLANELQLDGPPSELNVNWFSSDRTVQGSRKVTVGISSQHYIGRRFEMSGVRTIEELTLPVQTIAKEDLCRLSPYLRSVPMAEYSNARPRMLIGLDHHYLGMPLEVKTNRSGGGLVATKTVLGWIIYGCSTPVPRSQLASALTTHDHVSLTGSKDGGRMADGQSGNGDGGRMADGQSGNGDGDRMADGQSGSGKSGRMADGQSSGDGGRMADGQSGSGDGGRMADGQSSGDGGRIAVGQSGSGDGGRMADGRSSSQNVGSVECGRGGRSGSDGRYNGFEDEDNARYEQLHSLVKAFIATEDFGVKVPIANIESDDAIRSRKILEETTRRVGCRYETGLLWMNDDVCMPDNYNAAVRRLLTVESKMRRDPQYAAQYVEQIDSYVAKGYAHKLTAREAAMRNNKTWFLPHFAVVNINKPGKFRIVFDAAAKTNGVSLNTELLAGPDINVPLARLLLQFRLGIIGVTADIKEMYQQIRIRQADRDAQRFLWRRGNSNAKPDVYVMDVMTFGSTCSPAAAQFIKNANATEHEAAYPDAAQAIRQKHYVDDYVASFDSAEKALQTSIDVIEVHRRGGFELRGFASNSAKVMDGLRAETGSGEPVCMQLDESQTEKVLGMCWHTADDTFIFQTRFGRVQPAVMAGDRSPTKREILSVSMSVFDPYGFLCEFMLEAKIIMQDLWAANVDWDETIPSTMKKRWDDWRTEIVQTRQLKMPRCFTPHLRSSSDVQLHAFVDASELAFAAVVYLRVQHSDGVDISFVLGRTRCAPLKVLTVPRLELEAAVLGTRMVREIRDGLDLQDVQAVFWSDSSTVLKWIRSNQRKYKQFVQFRVSEILDATSVTNWRWVPTDMNPADDGTRVQRPPKFNPDARWTRGPEWLRSSEYEWPMPSEDGGDAFDDPEVRKSFVGIVNLSAASMVDFERFSKYMRLCRAVAWTQRFANNVRVSASLRKRGELGADEIDVATLTICRWVQQLAYAEEYKALVCGRELSVNSTIYTLKPYVDDDGLLRVYGRTDAAADEDLPFDTKRPILLPRNHRFTLLMVRNQHERMAHQMTNATVAAIRARFWVPQLRVLVRVVSANCTVCRRRLARPIAPVQGQLPKDRLTPYVRPFTNTGLDYFGPVAVTVGRRKEKRWIALFTCLSTRAVHLEIAADLSADSCMVCVRNLCHVRGTPKRIRCDNGTNFIGASNELAEEECFIDADAMQREMSTRGIEWLFNCPGNPQAGNIWKRLVQSVKRVLKVTLKEEAPRVETLRAHLLEAANMVNSRPLTHIPLAPDDEEALTPNHFLIGGPNAVTMAGPTEMEPSSVRKQWRVCRELSRRFWARWMRDYLPELTRRSKNYPERTDLKPDDLVVVCDGNQPRGQWPMGRVVSVVTGPDGRVRSAAVKTATGVYNRPVVKLAAFDVMSG